MLLVTVSIELAFAVTVLLVPWFAGGLDQANPPWWGWLVAVAAMPLLLAVDAAEKGSRRRRTHAGTGPVTPGGDDPAG